MDIGYWGCTNFLCRVFKTISGVTLNETWNKSNLGRGSQRLAMCSRFYFVDGAPKGRVTSFRNKNKLGWVEPHSRFHPGFPINLPFGVLVLFCTSCLCKLGTHNSNQKDPTSGCRDKILLFYFEVNFYWRSLFQASANSILVP